jgi:hypothetical protein
VDAADFLLSWGFGSSAKVKPAIPTNNTKYSSREE